MCSATNTSKNCSNCSAQLAMKAECETSCSPQLSLYRPTIWNQAFIIQLFLSWSRWERLGGCEIIAYNVDDRVLMMKGFELGEKKWNPRQLHCLLNLDNLSPGRADGKINWKWIWNAEIQICSVRGPAPEFSVLYRVKYRFWRAAALSANCWPRCTSPVHKSVGFRILSPHEESLHACLGFLVKV